MSAAGRCTVITACRDDGRWLREALDSVEDGLDLVLVDDGSTDPLTLALFDELRAEGRSVLRTEGLGLSAARNLAVAACDSEYILPLDADNRLRPGYAAAGVAALDADPGLAAAFGDRWVFGTGDDYRLVQGPVDVGSMLFWNTVDTCAVVRRTALDAVGGYDTRLPGVAFGLEDWKLWFDLIARGWGLHHLDMVGFDYRVREGSLSSNHSPESGHVVRAFFAVEHPEVVARGIADIVSQRDAFHQLAVDRGGELIEAWSRIDELVAERVG